MLARLSAFTIWALVAAALVFWGMRLFVQAPGTPAYAVAVGESSVARGDLNRLLGAGPVSAAPVAVETSAVGRFRLLGVMAPKASDGSGPAALGVALLTVDGKMPKAYVVGSPVDGDLVLQSVSLRSAAIGPVQGAATVTLEIPRAAAAATGTLPAGAGPVGRGAATPLPGAPRSVTAPIAAPAVPATPTAESDPQIQVNPRGAPPSPRGDAPAAAP